MQRALSEPRPRVGFSSARAAYGCILHEAPEGKIVCLVDEDGPKSVTNDLDNILPELADDLCTIRFLESPQQLLCCAIMYRDSMGIWDGVTWDGRAVGFYSIGELTFDRALAKIRQIAPIFVSKK